MNHPILITMKCNECARRGPECAECNGRGWVFAARLAELPKSWSMRVGSLLIQTQDGYRPCRARFDGDITWCAIRTDRDLHRQLHHLCRLRSIGAAK